MQKTADLSDNRSLACFVKQAFRIGRFTFLKALSNVMSILTNLVRYSPNRSTCWIL